MTDIKTPDAQANVAQPYDPDRDYDLEVAVPCRVGLWKYLPRDKITANGALINQLIKENGPDVIRSAEPRA